MTPGAILNASWCRARAEFNHDLLEKQLLPVLSACPPRPESRHRALIVHQAWTDVFAPALGRLINQFPACCLPGQLLADYASSAMAEQINQRASNAELPNGDSLASIRSRLDFYAGEIPSRLSEFEVHLDEQRKQEAVEAVMGLRRVLYEAPRGIVLS